MKEPILLLSDRQLAIYSRSCISYTAWLASVRVKTLN